MKQYRIYEHPLRTIEAVKCGWSWPAFFFCTLWALFKKLWVLACVVFVVLFTFGFIVGLMNMDVGLTNFIIYSVSLVESAIFGVYGNSWRENNLMDRGYEYMQGVEANSADAAIAIHIKGGRSSSQRG